MTEPQRRGPKGVGDADAFVGSRIRTLRLGAGESERELGKALSPPVSQAMMGIMERGKSRVPLRVVYQVAAHYEIPIEQLFFDLVCPCCHRPFTQSIETGEKDE